MLSPRVYGPNVREAQDWHVVLWANLARALCGRFKADYHGNKSFNLCSKAFLWNWRLSILTEGKEKWVVFEAEGCVFFFFFLMQVAYVLWRWLEKTARHFKRFSDMDFLQIRVINFSGHLMRGRWKEGDALRSPCSDVQNRNSIAAIRYLRVHSTHRGH